MPLLVGQYLGDYSLLDLLAQGGYAQVYRCEHRTSKIERAIKVAEKSLLSTEVQNNFLNEARIHKKMQHPNIVKFHDSGEVNGYFFLVMDYVSDTLGRFSGQKLEPTTVASFVKQNADALYYIHSKNVVHCDVKPDNMLIDANGRILLCDFGIAVDLTYQAGSRYGTIEYISPERLRGQPCPASDQYALAVAMYEWLSGEFPFDNQRDILAKPPASLCQKIPTLAPDIEQVIFRALAKEPQDRFPDILTLAYEFERSCQLTQSQTSPKPFGSLQYPTQPLPSPALNTFPPTRKLGIPNILQPGGASTPTRALFPKVGGSKVLYTYRGHRSGVNALAWSPDGKQIASAAMDRSVKVWDITSGIDLLTYRGHSRVVWNILWSYDGSRIASADEVQSVRLWDARTADTLFLYQHRVGPPDEVGVALDYPMAWSRDGQSIVSASDDQPLERWNTITGNRLMTYNGHTSSVKAISWSPDETKIATGSSDQTVYVWDVATGATLYMYRNHKGTVRTLAWSPDGTRIASAGSDGTVRVWNAMNGSNELIYAGHRPRSVNSLAWAPDGSKIVSAGGDQTVRIWDTVTGKIVNIYREHTDTINTVAWSPSGDAIASASDDGTVRIWSV